MTSDQTHSSTSQVEKCSIIIVGGGIAGLYASYILGKSGYRVTVLEQSDRWGGRIESVKLPSDQDPKFIAEFGPMRFEPGLQTLLRKLAEHLDLHFEHFADTTAPSFPTEYELSDIEASFARTSDLLMWAVLRLFFAEPSVDKLASVVLTDEERAREGVGQDPQGMKQLSALKAELNTIFDLDYEAVQKCLDGIRQTRRLFNDSTRPLLRKMGLWNALAEILTPGGVAKVRDTGTFYHFISHNPSAAEWGIFWLRQASKKGEKIQTFSRDTAPNGVSTIIDRLRAKISAQCQETVHLYLSQKVIGLDNGKFPGDIEVRVEDQISGIHPYTLRADHVILALPQTPLRKLSDNFPDNIRQNIEGVLPLPLLKAFLVTTQPWWQYHMKAQSHAWLVPTRELHYYTFPNNSHCDGQKSGSLCNCSPGSLGMVMLYTDAPSIEFWRALVDERKYPKHEKALVYDQLSTENTKGKDLKRALVEHLLVQANPPATDKIRLERRQVEKVLIEQFDAEGQSLVNEAQQPNKTLLEVLRVFFTKRPERHSAYNEMFRGMFGGDENWVGKILHDSENDLSLQERTDSLMPSVVAYGIHDWSREPFGGAAHLWRRGTKSVEVLEQLAAFGLRGRSDIRNIHICGEAYSDFQGFIEGALSSALKVCRSIAARDSVTLDSRLMNDLTPKPGEEEIKCKQRTS